MCGNGKSCDECGRGPCGPTYEPTPASHWTDQGKCPHCGGSGQLFIRGSNRGGIYERCRDCGGTGKTKEARFAERKADGELGRRIEKRIHQLNGAVEIKRLELKEMEKEIKTISLKTYKLCEDCQGTGYQTIMRTSTYNGRYEDVNKCKVCNTTGLVKKGKGK